MIKLFKDVNNKLITIKEKDVDNIFNSIEKNMWIHVSCPKQSDMEKISKVTSFDKDLLITLMDEEESAHLELDDDYTLIVLDIPIYSNGTYETYPFSIIYNDDYYLTICKKDTQMLEQMLNKFKKIEPHKHVRLTLQIMYRIASSYIVSLKALNAVRKNFENTLHTAVTNKELLELNTLNKAFVYFSTSLNANKIVLNKVKRLPEYKKYEDDFDLMEDVEVENSQAIEMCSIYRDILSGMMETSASIISNNLNIVMKSLAIITRVISIPTLIASLFGMNVKVPFGTSENGFYIIIGFSLVLAILGGILLYIYTSKVSATHKSKRNNRRRK